VTIEALSGRGVFFVREDDDLGDVHVAALRAGTTTFLLRWYPADPVPGVAVHTVTAGDATEQLAELVRALSLSTGDAVERLTRMSG
jgi:hypothetical protein